MERTTIDLEDGSGQHGLRATGQVVLFPGYLALYEEGKDDEGDEDSRRLPRMSSGDAPAKKAVNAEQHFTQPPPRFSEASLVKRLEELGIGRPSTYASIIQVLKDRAYVRIEKNRFFAEESGRLLTAFLERFFEKYVSATISPPSWRKSSTTSRAAAPNGRRCSRRSGRTSSRAPPK
jgi:DNA topoisomerase-1